MLRLLTRSMSILVWVSLIYSVPFLSRLYSNTVDDDASISILTWADVFDAETLDVFTQKTGIKVQLSYYESNEEMLVKLQATGGKGYDLVVPSDYAVAVLKERNLLQKIDRTKVPAMETFLPLVTHQPSDPLNEYSLPYLWEIFVLGIDKRVVSPEVEPSWRLLFKPPVGVRVAMASDPREAMIFAHQYVYGDPAPLLPEQIKVLTLLLRKQKTDVEAYVEFRSDYLLATHNCGVAVSSSSYILRSMEQFSHIGFVVPREGTFITVENFVIPRASQKADLVYRFMNHIYALDVMAHLYETFSFFPATRAGLEHSHINQTERNLLQSIQTIPLHFIQLLTTEKELQKFWVAVKA